MNILVFTMQKTTALKPQDVLVACKLYSLAEKVRPSSDWSYVSLSTELGLSTGEIHNALDRGRRAQLIVTVRSQEIVSKKHLFDLLVFAVPRIFYAVRGGLEIGLPTSIQAKPLLALFEKLKSETTMLPSVWPCSSADGVQGESISPLYPSVPEAAKCDPYLYELLALVDVVRIGDTKCRNLAVSLLEKKILG